MFFATFLTVSLLSLSFRIWTTLAFKNGFRLQLIARKPFGQMKIHMLDEENPDAGDSPPFHQRTLHEHPEKTEASSLLESEVCDYGILTALAEEHVALGNYDEAMKLAKKAIATADHTREVNNIYSAYAEGIWGDALYSKGLYQESADHYHGALKTYERHYQSKSGPEAVELVGAINLAAWNLLSKKDYEEATAAWSTALGMTERLLGPKNTDVAGCMTNLAISHINMGDVGPAPEALLKKALSVYEEKKTEQFDMKKMQEHDEPIWKIKTYLGDLFFFRGDDESASEYYRSVEAIYNNIGDIDDIKASRAFEKFGIIEWRKGLKEHAVKLFEDGIYLIEKKSSSRNPEDSMNLGRVKGMLKSLRRGESAPKALIPSTGEENQ